MPPFALLMSFQMLPKSFPELAVGLHHSGSHRTGGAQGTQRVALSNWFKISYELMNQENKLFSVHALCQVLFLMPTHTNVIILCL